MKVGFVVSDLGLGGTQAFVELAAVNLSQLGHAVTVFVEHGPFDRSERLDTAGVEVVAFARVPAIADYAKEIRQRGIELVHLNVWERLDVLRGISALAGVPVALSYHHVPKVRPWCHRLRSPRLVISSVLDIVRESKGIDAHIGCCEAAAVQLRRLFQPFFQDRIYALRNAIPLPQPNDASVLGGTASFLQVGALTERKNPFAALRAFSAVVENFPCATLTFIGDGPERSRLESFARQHQVTGVVFAGEVGNPSPFYEAANVMVLPSSCEGLPYTLIEAAGRGMAAIATSVDGIPEIVRDQENGILVPPGDDAALEKAMRLLAADGDLRGSLGTKGRQLVEQEFEIGRFTASLVGIYRSILQCGRQA